MIPHLAVSPVPKTHSAEYPSGGRRILGRRVRCPPAYLSVCLPACLPACRLALLPSFLPHRLRLSDGQVFLELFVRHKPIVHKNVPRPMTEETPEATLGLSAGGCVVDAVGDAGALVVVVAAAAAAAAASVVLYAVACKLVSCITGSPAEQPCCNRCGSRFLRLPMRPEGVLGLERKKSNKKKSDGHKKNTVGMGYEME